MTATTHLPVEGALPDLDGATAWLNSNPLTPAGLRGKVVVVQFCTFSCINWLRTMPYIKGSVASVENKIGQAWLMCRRPHRVSASRSNFSGFRFPPDVIMVAVR